MQTETITLKVLWLQHLISFARCTFFENRLFGATFRGGPITSLSKSCVNSRKCYSCYSKNMKRYDTVNKLLLIILIGVCFSGLIDRVVGCSSFDFTAPITDPNCTYIMYIRPLYVKFTLIRAGHLAPKFVVQMGDWIWNTDWKVTKWCDRKRCESDTKQTNTPINKTRFKFNWQKTVNSPWARVCDIVIGWGGGLWEPLFSIQCNVHMWTNGQMTGYSPQLDGKEGSSGSETWSKL